jgi:hypothetical protein
MKIKKKDSTNKMKHIINLPVTGALISVLAESDLVMFQTKEKLIYSLHTQG